MFHSQATSVLLTPDFPRMPASTLSPREREVAILIAHGLTNRQIAQRLVIALRTADNHVQHIFDKLGFSSRAQLAAWSVAHGLLSFRVAVA